MMASYAQTYGGVPAPDSSWRLFLALVSRAPQFAARTQLSLYDSIVGALGAAFGGGSAAKTERDMLLRRAYPVKDTEPVFHENMFAPGYGESRDA